MTDSATRWERGRIDADVDVPAAKRGAPEHDDWIIDEALEESFPASDAPNPARPGSSIALRNAGRDDNASPLLVRPAVTPLVMTAGLVLLGVLAALVVSKKAPR